jgi:hypothetical protein
MDGIAPLPSLSFLESSADTGGVPLAADLMVERKALDNQTQMMSELLSTGLPQQGAYLDLSPAAQSRLS